MKHTAYNSEEVVEWHNAFLEDNPEGTLGKVTISTLHVYMVEFYSSNSIWALKGGKNTVAQILKAGLNLSDFRTKCSACILLYCQPARCQICTDLSSILINSYKL